MRGSLSLANKYFLGSSICGGLFGFYTMFVDVMYDDYVLVSRNKSRDVFYKMTLGSFLIVSGTILGAVTGSLLVPGYTLYKIHSKIIGDKQ